MKHLILYSAAMFAIISIAACDRRPDVEGSWQGAPQRLDLAQASTAMATPAITFRADSTVTIMSAINLTEPMPQSQSPDAPYQISISAIATAEGRWQYDPSDDDEIIITINPDNVSVSVDTDAVTFAQNMLTGSQTPAVDSLRPQLAEYYRRMLTPAMQAEFAAYRRLEDVEVKSGVLKFEILDRDIITMTATPAMP